MHPILIELGPVRLYTYGLFVALGFLAAVRLAAWRAKKKNSAIDPARITDLFFVILISSLVGARLLYIAQNLPLFLDHPLEMLKIWKGGLVFYGGFIGALVAAVLFIRINRLPLWPTADLLAPSIALGHGVGRMGCFFAGCCHGRACDLPWAVTFTHPQALAPLDIPLHPTQLYAVTANLLIAAFLLVLDRKPGFAGRIFWIYVCLYGITRSIIEVFRGDERGAFVMDILSPSQTIGLAAALVALVMLARLYRKDMQQRKRTDA